MSGRPEGEAPLNVLLVEDDRAIAKVISMELQHQGHHVSLAADGKTGLSRAMESDWDIVLLDIMLPYLSGYEVCREIRLKKDIPILLLTAKGEVRDKVLGLDLGADDYLTKPFAMDELLARMRAVLRRKNPQPPREQGGLRFRELELDLLAYRVYFSGQEIHLTKKEFELLAFFMEHPQHVLSREMILENVWGYDYYGDTNIVDVYVRFLRGKLDEPFQVHYLQTVRGVGYVLRAEE
ncbi:Two component system, signal transduction response regulator [Acididesulfobacillus acetoxydans]|uniref:Stage 0 sporulation protein A homolog n=1 Tax=Acididesulfobacillus acetoxydans TaxID=1561005 RepID=A0A8S0W1K0_9FIRM|nr:response regulator transcription factor [Acididesulfobacillus acetoxydans]CAA7599418.1 Two component system, signal transduction response regulator [Acididesulfobacillus acetoxydans]CEJ06776.1 Response regulator ArlR [Acididesulfobacillus acetoxydans]